MTKTWEDLYTDEKLTLAAKGVASCIDNFFDGDGPFSMEKICRIKPEYEDEVVAAYTELVEAGYIVGAKVK